MGEDTGDLFLEEREKEIQRVQMEKQSQAEQVPGLLNPHHQRAGDGGMKDDQQDRNTNPNHYPSNPTE